MACIIVSDTGKGTVPAHNPHNPNGTEAKGTLPNFLPHGLTLVPFRECYHDAPELGHVYHLDMGRVAGSSTRAENIVVPFAVLTKVTLKLHSVRVHRVIFRMPMDRIHVQRAVVTADRVQVYRAAVRIDLVQVHRPVVRMDLHRPVVRMDLVQVHVAVLMAERV